MNNLEKWYATKLSFLIFFWKKWYLPKLTCTTYHFKELSFSNYCILCIINYTLHLIASQYIGFDNIFLSLMRGNTQFTKVIPLYLFSQIHLSIKFKSTSLQTLLTMSSVQTQALSPKAAPHQAFYSVLLCIYSHLCTLIIKYKGCGSRPFKQIQNYVYISAKNLLT